MTNLQLTHDGGRDARRRASRSALEVQIRRTVGGDAAQGGAMLRYDQANGGAAVIRNAATVVCDGSAGRAGSRSQAVDIQTASVFNGRDRRILASAASMGIARSAQGRSPGTRPGRPARGSPPLRPLRIASRIHQTSSALIPSSMIPASDLTMSKAARALPDAAGRNSLNCYGHNNPPSANAASTGDKKRISCAISIATPIMGATGSRGPPCGLEADPPRLARQPPAAHRIAPCAGNRSTARRSIPRR